MCAFAARETRIGRVVFAIKSPMMGGVSKWNVLRDTELSNAMPEVFGPVPEVVAGLLQEEAERIWMAGIRLFGPSLSIAAISAAMVPTSATGPFTPYRNDTAFYAGCSLSITTPRTFSGNCGFSYWP